MDAEKRGDPASGCAETGDGLLRSLGEERARPRFQLLEVD